MIRKSEHIKDKTVSVLESVILSDKSYEERENEIVDMLYDAFLSEKHSS